MQVRGNYWHLEGVGKESDSVTQIGAGVLLVDVAGGTEAHQESGKTL